MNNVFIYLNKNIVLKCVYIPKLNNVLMVSSYSQTALLSIKCNLIPKPKYCAYVCSYYPNRNFHRNAHLQIWILCSNVLTTPNLKVMLKSVCIPQIKYCAIRAVTFPNQNIVPLLCSHSEICIVCFREYCTSVVFKFPNHNIVLKCAHIPKPEYCTLVHSHSETWL